jgi:hypothetical protein
MCYRVDSNDPPPVGQALFVLWERSPFRFVGEVELGPPQPPRPSLGGGMPRPTRRPDRRDAGAGRRWWTTQGG